jgi:hypothetical protein
MVKVLGETSSIQGITKQVYYSSALSAYCTPEDGLISRKCTGVINLFCETYLVLFLSFLGLKIFHLEPSPSSLRVIVL